MMGMIKLISLASSLLLLSVGYVDAHENFFDIAKFGGKCDADITKAFSCAWKEACAATAASTISIPKGTYYLNNIELTGPCKAPITMRIEGILKAPADPAHMKAQGEWVCIRNVDKLTINGGGTFDGQGKMAWSKNDCQKTGKCNKLPNVATFTNLSFNFLNDAVIEDITTLDSKLFHVNVLGCKNIVFRRFKVCAPAESLNTDGIHLGRSSQVTIIDTEIKTGDDCVSIGDGVQTAVIERVTCGPGHGIAVGSLGKYPKEEPVINVLVRNCTITGTDNGVRIKTWPNEEPGEVADVRFEDIIMNNVGNPVLIDQQYCPSNKCKKGASKVKISKIIFKNIRGTSTTKEAVQILCSPGIPCETVEMANIDLKYVGKEPGPAISICSNLKQPNINGIQNPPACSSKCADKEEL